MGGMIGQNSKCSYGAVYEAAELIVKSKSLSSNRQHHMTGFVNCIRKLMLNGLGLAPSF